MADSDKTKKPVRESLARGGIEIRRYDPGMVEKVYEAIDESRADLAPWMFWMTPEYSLDDARGFAEKVPVLWESGEGFSFNIIDGQSGAVLGGCGLNAIDKIHKRANLGYWVRTSARGRGVAARATRLLSEISFEDIGLIRLEIIIAVENLASKRVAEKAGAHFEGVLKNRLMPRGVALDAFSYSLIP